MALGLMSILVFEGLMNTENVSGTTIVVDKNGHGDYSTIQEAIDNATMGDVIRVWDGVYNETLEIYFSIEIIGNGSANTIIDASESWWEPPVYICANYVNISGFNITKGPWDGIYIDSSNYVNIFNNTISSNYYGIEILFSTNITIKDNTFTNNTNSIMFNECSGCNVINNTIFSYEVGVDLEFSDHISLSKNKFNNCGVKIGSAFYADYVSHWTTHTIDSSNTVNGKPLIYWKNKGTGTVPAGAGQIILANCSNIIVDKQDCSETTAGVLIGLCSKITVKNSIFNFNAEGINVQLSDNITINNNNISFNGNGIYISQSSWNTITYNTVNRNSYYGMNLDWSCNENTISNNDFIANQDCGLFISLSNNNTISKNRFNRNWCFGLFIGWQCEYLYIFGNEMCHNNVSGIFLGAASFNTINENNISNNDFGIQIGWDCFKNDINENMISNNLDTGLEIISGAQKNRIYHNNFISNQKQALDSSGMTNYWSTNYEGNYWSDYTGQDDGSYGRFKGDLIGDTDLPHPDDGYDLYPFIMINGWRNPGSPIINKPSNIDFDGNYNLTWLFCNRTTGYILEEDETGSFTSPTEIFNSSGTFFEVKNKPEGKYYYRLRTYNSWKCSAWSEIVNVTVDFKPDVPANFMVTVDPAGNALNISWKTNVVETKCYELYYKTNGMQDYELLANLSHPENYFLHTGLIDGQVYYYKIRAKDKYWQDSEFSNEISAIPKDSTAPDAPKLVNASAISDSKIRLTWLANDDPDLAGYLVYISDPTQDENGEFRLILTLPKTNTTCMVSNLKEQITYQFKLQAFDEVPNNSSFSNIMNSTTPDETHPSAPTGLTVSNATYNSLTVSWEPILNSDVVGYILFRSTSLSTDFVNITTVITDTTYVDTGLNEVTIYYYKLRSIDDASLESLLSEAAYGMTLLGPRSPEVDKEVADFELEEDTTDNTTISLLTWFKDANDDLLTFSCVGQQHILVNIDQETGTVLLTPEQNWNGIETLTFFASDGAFEINDSVVITVTAVNDAPTNAVIKNPADGLKIKTGQKINFEGDCTDPDLPYGEVLTYTWESSISGSIGTGKSISNIELVPGEHIITLKVMDNAGETTTTSITIDVSEKSKEKDTELGFGELSLYILSAVIVIVIIFCMIYLLTRKKSSSETEEQKIVEEDQDQEKEKEE